MKILVEHEIPCDKGLEFTCKSAGDFWGNSICKYHTHRNRTHGRKAPKERAVPKCTLFDEWLPAEYQKCGKCIISMIKHKDGFIIPDSLEKWFKQLKVGSFVIISNSTANALECAKIIQITQDHGQIKLITSKGIFLEDRYHKYLFSDIRGVSGYIIPFTVSVSLEE